MDIGTVRDIDEGKPIVATADDRAGGQNLDITLIDADNPSLGDSSRREVSMRMRFTSYEDPRIRKPLLQRVLAPYQRGLLSGQIPWNEDDPNGEQQDWRERFIGRLEDAGLQVDRNGQTARISTGYRPSNVLLMLCEDRRFVDPYQIVLDFPDDERIDGMLVHKVALFGTVYRAFPGASDLRVFKAAYAIPQEKGGHVFCGSLAKARELIREMQNEQTRVAAAAERAAALEAEAKAARELEEEEFAIASAFE